MNLRNHYVNATLTFAIPLPLVIIGHEVSHYLVARSLGYFPHLTYDQNEFSGGPSFSRHRPWICASAMFFHMTLGVAGAVALWRLRNAHRRPRAVWIASALCLAGCYHLLHLVGFVVNRQKTGSIDEHIVSAGLGLPAWSIHFVLWPLALCFLAWLLQFHWRQRTMLALFFGLTAGGASLTCYFLVWGPLLLPHKAGSIP